MEKYFYIYKGSNKLTAVYVGKVKTTLAELKKALPYSSVESNGYTLVFA